MARHINLSLRLDEPLKDRFEAICLHHGISQNLAANRLFHWFLGHDDKKIVEIISNPPPGVVEPRWGRYRTLRNK